MVDEVKTLTASTPLQGAFIEACLSLAHTDANYIPFQRRSTLANIAYDHRNTNFPVQPYIRLYSRHYIRDEMANKNLVCRCDDDNDDDDGIGSKYDYQ